MIGNAGILTA